MNDERFLTLIEGYLSEELTDSESEELFRLLQKDPNRQTYFTSQLKTSRGLDFLSKPANDAAILESVLSIIAQNGSRDQRVADGVMREIARRSQRRRKKRESRAISWGVLSAAAIIVLCVCGWLVTKNDEKATRIFATVESIDGTLRRRRANTISSVAIGESIELGDELQGTDGVAVLRFSDGTRITTGNYTSTTLQSTDGAKEFVLTQGSLIVNAAPQPALKPLSIETPHARIELVGTVVHVSASVGLTRLQVDEGKVKMRALSPVASEVLVVAGHSASVGTGESKVHLELGANSAQSVKLQSGWWGEYYKNTDFTGLVSKRVDGPIQFNWGMAAPMAGMPQDRFSVRWSGYLIPPTTNDYQIYALCDDSVRIWVENDKGQLILLFDRWGEYMPTSDQPATIRLRAGGLHRIRIDYKDEELYAFSHLSWSTSSTPKEPIPLKYMACPQSGPAALAPQIGTIK